MIRLVSEWLKRVVLELQDYMRLVGRVATGLVSRPIYGRDIVDRLRAAGFADARIEPAPARLFGHPRPVVVAVRGD